MVLDEKCTARNFLWVRKTSDNLLREKFVFSFSNRYESLDEAKYMSTVKYDTEINYSWFLYLLRNIGGKNYCLSVNPFVTFSVRFRNTKRDFKRSYIIS